MATSLIVLNDEQQIVEGMARTMLDAGAPHAEVGNFVIMMGAQFGLTPRQFADVLVYMRDMGTLPYPDGS
jgi:hypothetical protein